tara:strand:- start:45 stop:302 length:258 start_codon:yes stop_codon:yes gene_type:complete
MRLWGRDIPGQHGRAKDVPATSMQQDQKRTSQLQNLGERLMTGEAVITCQKCGIKGVKSHFGLVAVYPWVKGARNLCWHCWGGEQ